MGFGNRTPHRTDRILAEIVPRLEAGRRCRVPARYRAFRRAPGGADHHSNNNSQVRLLWP